MFAVSEDLIKFKQECRVVRHKNEGALELQDALNDAFANGFTQIVLAGDHFVLLKRTYDEKQTEEALQKMAFELSPDSGPRN